MAQEKDVDFYEIITRGGGIVIAILLWFVSMRFSVDGFQIASEENVWVGIVLGATVTYLQVMFNRGAPNKTLYFAGLLAYIYGMATNLIGIMAIRSNSFDWTFISTEPLSFVLQLVVVFTIAMSVEVLPEHLMIHSIRPDGNDGDFLDSLFRGMPRRNGAPRTGFKKSPQQGTPQPPKNKDKGNRPENRPGRPEIDPNRMRPDARNVRDERTPHDPRQIPVNTRGDKRPPISIRRGDE